MLSVDANNRKIRARDIISYHVKIRVLHLQFFTFNVKMHLVEVGLSFPKLPSIY